MQQFVTYLHGYEVVSIDNMVVVDYCDLVDWHPLSTPTCFGR